MSDESTAVARVEAGGALNAFASETSFVSAQRMAKALATSSLVPQAYRNNLGDCLIAIELANRTGASVLMVMQNLDIIHGRPSWRSTFLIATVNAGGRFSPLRFRFQGAEGSDEWGCRAVARDKEDGEECVGPLVTIATAKAEGWYAKAGSKWKTIPELMLTYRAAAWWTRIYAPEVSLGMLTAEEAEYLPPEPAARARDISAALRAAEVVPAETVTTEPVTLRATVVEEAAASVEAEDGEPVDARLKSLNAKYFALLGERGIGTDDRRTFQARLHRDGLVASASCRDWTRQDYLSAIAEVSEIPVEAAAGVGAEVAE